MNLHNFFSVEGMATKFNSKTNISKTRNMMCHFINNDVILGNYDVMTDSSKSVSFMWHKDFQKCHKSNLIRHKVKV